MSRYLLFKPTFKNITCKWYNGKINHIWAINLIRLNSNWIGDEQQLLHVSKIPTFHFQKSLPRLPIPKLEETCNKYLSAQRPILTNEQYSETEKIVAEFQANYGQELHDKLVSHDKANKETSYISKPWFEYYLKSRLPLVLNYTPFIAMKDDPKKDYNNQVLRASNIILSSLRFMKSLKKEVLNPDVFHLNPKKSDTSVFKTFTSFLPSAISWYGAFLFKAYPLDMSQYKNLFHTTRIPCKYEDKIYCDPQSRHILVMRKGNFYVFDVLDENGLIRSPKEILACIDMIVKKDDPCPEYPIGYLSSENRDVWAEVRQHLSNSGNSEQLKMIDSALFCLNLDDMNPEGDIQLCENFLYGPGFNRWFDKSLSVILTPGGQVAITFEHSWGDGVAVLRYFNELYSDTCEKPQLHPADLNDSLLIPDNTVSKLDIVLDDYAKSAVSKAKHAYKQLTSSLDLKTLKYNKFGKSYIQKCGLGHDSVMQLGFQLAHYKLKGNTVATYESASTSAFKHGRTETVRPATMETKLFTHEVSKSDKDYSKLREMLHQCSVKHSSLTKSAVLGKGFDRHLFALKYFAQKEGRSHSLFDDPAYSVINHIILSTSTLSSPAVAAGGFGAVVKDGFGIGYSVQDELLGSIVTCYTAHNNSQDFITCLTDAFNDIYDVLEKTTK